MKNLIPNEENPIMGTLKYDWISQKYPVALNLLAGNDIEITASESEMQNKPEESAAVIELTSDDILQIHENMVTRFGGELGIRDREQFESLSIGPYQSYFGEELYPGIIYKGAKYLFDFAHYQTFVDGNKRTGLATLCAFLRANNFDLTLTDYEAYNLVMDISNDKYTEVDQIVDLIKVKPVEVF